ncbi:MAG: tetratricopeptide repeat protein [Bacteroidales bacterium]|nr:tetratricopeptide repeat protein [Bacteroidales bacterium]
MIDRNTQRLIEKLIDGSISKKEGQTLSSKIETDVSLKREFELRKELETIVAEEEFFQLRQKLQLVAASTSNSLVRKGSTFNKISVRKYLYYAATFSGIALGGWGALTLTHKTTDPTNIYLENFQPYPAVTVVRSGGELNLDSIFFSAMLSYQRGDYNSAIVDFRKVIEINPNAFTVQFYLGITYMELLDFEKAHENLMVVAKSNSLFRDQALWYCGLCYLGEFKVEKAKTIFSNLSNSTSPLGQKATKLLSDLSNE